MSNLKTPSLISNSHSVASVRSQDAANRKISASLWATSTAAVLFVAGSLGMAAPAQAQTYQSSNSYSASTQAPITGRVVNISTYMDNQANTRQSDLQRRNEQARQQARSNTASLIGSVVSSMAREALGGSNRSYNANQAVNIGSQMAGQIAANTVRARGSRVNSQGWEGNVRSMGEQMSLLTIDVRYNNGRMERIQVRQPAPYSEGISRGDEVTLQVVGSGNNSMVVAVETPRSRAGYRP